MVGRSMGDVDRTLDGLRGWLIVISISGLLAAAFVGWLVADRVLRPVARLAAATEQVAETRRFDADLRVEGSDELGALARGGRGRWRRGWQYRRPAKRRSALAACKQRHHGHQHGDANAHMHENDFEDLVQRFDDPARADWQKPDEVIAFLGDIVNNTIMDIGCGTGYFSFKLVEAGALVIAADVDDRFLSLVKEKKQESGLDDKQLSTRKLPYDSPELAASEVDMVLIVDTYHHIEDRENYFAKVKNGLKENGRLVVIDFKKEESPMGPPKKMRMSAAFVQAELEGAGFSAFSVDSLLLPYQYILIAQ